MTIRTRLIYSVVKLQVVLTLSAPLSSFATTYHSYSTRACKATGGVKVGEVKSSLLALVWGIGGIPK